MGRGDGEYVVNLYNPLAHLGICIFVQRNMMMSTPVRNWLIEE
jgi:hypothetical protein